MILKIIHKPSSKKNGNKNVQRMNKVGNKHDNNKVITIELYIINMNINIKIKECKIKQMFQRLYNKTGSM